MAESPKTCRVKVDGCPVLNAVYRLMHCETPEQAICETAYMGGDTDTNCAVAGALAGAYFGYDMIPKGLGQNSAGMRHLKRQFSPQFCSESDKRDPRTGS